MTPIVAQAEAGRASVQGPYLGSLRAGSDDPMVVGEHDGGGAIPHAELREDGPDVRLHCRLSDVERCRDLGVGGTTGHVPEHFVLSVRELGEADLPRRVAAPGVAGGAQHAPGDLWVEPGGAARDGAGGCDQVVGRGVLEDEAGGAGIEGTPEHVVVVEGRQDQHGAIGVLVVEPPGGGHAIDPPHPDVHEHDVGPVGCDGVHDLVAVVALRDHLEPVVGAEDPRDPGPYDRLVVDDQHADHRSTRPG